MENAARVSEGVFHEVGRVVAAGPGSALEVESVSGRFEARRAASCLLAPAPRDEVLLAVPISGPLYVLAVLRRESDEPLRLCLDDDASITCAGQLSLFAADRLDLRAGDEVATTARSVNVTAVETTVSTDRLSLVGRLVEAHASHLKGVLGTVDTVLERLSQKVKSSYRYVEGLDMTRAGEVDLRARKTMNLRGKNAFMSAEDLVKMQGEQIHLG